MPVTPGSATKKNALKGLVRTMDISASDFAAATATLQDGIFIKSAGKLYMTDGTTPIKDLTPIIDTSIAALSSFERSALNASLGTGTYVATAGGVVVTNANNKIDDAQLNVVANGKIVESYLSEYIDQTTHQVLLSALPDTVRAGVTYVADYAALQAIAPTSEATRGVVFVVDASGDPSVDSGAAIYAYVPNPAYTEGGAEPEKIWQKYAEVEGLDIDLDAIAASYDNVQAAGAVMYDHTVIMSAPTLAEYAALTD